VPIFAMQQIVLRLKANSKILEKIGENLKKWVSQNCNLAYFA